MDEALKYLERSLETFTTLYGAEPTNLAQRRAIALANARLAALVILGLLTVCLIRRTSLPPCREVSI
jgi:hypothetical protein